MRQFLDSSVVIAACGRAAGASRTLFDLSENQGWMLQTSAYVIAEVELNILKLPPSASASWLLLRRRLQQVPDVFSFEWPAPMTAAKDRPILFTAVAWSDVLLTLDRRDFRELVGQSFYGLPILKPGEFLEYERNAGRLP